MGSLFHRTWGSHWLVSLHGEGLRCDVPGGVEPLWEVSPQVSSGEQNLFRNNEAASQWGKRVMGQGVLPLLHLLRAGLSGRALRASAQ